MAHARCTTASAPANSGTSSSRATSATAHSVFGTRSLGARRAMPTMLSTRPCSDSVLMTLVPTLPVAPVTTTRTLRRLPHGGRAETSVLGTGDSLQPLNGAPQEPRHVHLRDADATRDLRLAQVFGEPHVEQHPLALGKRAHRSFEHGAQLDELEALIVGAESRPPAGVFLAILRGFERGSVVGHPHVEPLDHVLAGESCPLRQFADRG